MTTAYVTSATADDYLAAKPNTTLWFTKSSADKDKYLLQATMIIDRLNYAGLKTPAYTEKLAGGTRAAIRAAGATQEHQFPRNSDTTVPADIENACCEIAYSLCSGIDPDEELRLLATTGESVGPLGLKMTFNRSNHAEWTLAGVPSPTAWQMLLPYIRDCSGFDIRRV
jgi:hypothetical protein